MSEAVTDPIDSGDAKIQPRDSWLERNRKKQRRTRIIGWFIAFGFLGVIAAIVLVLLWFAKVGPFKQHST